MQEEDQQGILHLMPKKKAQHLVSRVSSLAGWRRHSAHSHRWRQAFDRITAQLRGAEEDLSGHPRERDQMQTMQQSPM